MWDLSCPDWEQRIREGRSLIPDLPLIESEAEMGLQFFDELRLPDVPGKPLLRDAAGPWFRDIVRAAFGSWDPVRRVRHIRDIFSMAPKGSSKTTLGAGLMIASMLMNTRPRGEALFVGPTQAISDRAYEQAVGMIEESPDLKSRFRTHDHNKTIEDLRTLSEGKVRTFDVSILTGSILFFVMLDEIHILGRSAHTAKVLRQIRGGLDKTQEGLMLVTTTQSDDAPVGAFRDELAMARKIRDGKFRGTVHRPMLPVLYEFPASIASDPEQWQDPDNWPMVMPNLGRSVHMDTLIPDWESERTKGQHAIRLWASQHLNIEIGVGLNDSWRGADYWEGAADESLREIEELIERSEVITIGVDGGGLDDLLGLAVIGRCKKTRDWLSWNHAWAQTDVLDLRKDISQNLRDFQEGGDLTICESGTDDIVGVADIIERVVASGLVPAQNGIGLDAYGVAALIDELATRAIVGERLKAIPQGTKLSPAVWGLERKLKDGTFWHAGRPLMAWCVGNAKAEVRGGAVMIAKQTAGRAKIDPLVATFNAAMLMAQNPQAAAASFWEAA